MSHILLTGATGFLGSAVAQALQADPKYVLAVVKRRVSDLEGFTLGHLVPSLDSASDWRAALRNCDVVIHAAARVHVMREDACDPLSAYRKVNVEGTLNLARQAATAGVKRFIFISSIKVNGESTVAGQPFTAENIPAPEDPYGASKLEAEQALMGLAAYSEMEIVIIRPPLVYGPGVKGNFASMSKLVAKGYPLPLGAIHNRRSLVALDNLVDLIIRCINHPAAAGQVFLAADGEDLSTSDLLRRMAKAMGQPSRLIPVPGCVLQLGGALLGKRKVSQRLLGSLQVDISKARELLGWVPPISVDEGLRRCFPVNKD